MRYFIVFLMLAGVKGYAQAPCAADMAQRQFLNDAGFLQNQVQNHAQAKMTSTVFIPVVFHVLYNNALQNIPDSLLLSNLAVMNRDFAKKNADTASIPSVFRSHAAGVDWKFCLAARDPSGNATTGIIRKHTDSIGYAGYTTPLDPTTGGADVWPSSDYVNIVVCNMNGGFYGYGTFPANPHQGITLHYEYVGAGALGSGRLMTHEMGHYFYLFHIWGEKNCGDDLIADTPPQQWPSLILPTDPCPVYPHVSCNNGSDGDNFYDYMDYSKCASMFTVMQAAKMQNTLTTYRSSLLSSTAGCQNATSVNDVTQEAGIFPNPSTGTFTVRDPQQRYERLQVMDLTGRMIREVPLVREQMVMLPGTGIYVYRLMGKNGFATGKLVIR
jgi:hypothetical protein